MPKSRGCRHCNGLGTTPCGGSSPAAIEEEIGGLAVKVVSYEDLVVLKEQAGRPEDLTDLQRLRQARGEE